MNKENENIEKDDKSKKSIDLSQIYGDPAKRVTDISPEELAKIIKQMLRGKA